MKSLQVAGLLPWPSRLAAERGKLEPGVGVLVHWKHQTAHRQERLPDFMVALDAAQPVLPHLACQAPAGLCRSLVACMDRLYFIA